VSVILTLLQSGVATPLMPLFECFVPNISLVDIFVFFLQREGTTIYPLFGRRDFRKMKQVLGKM
jgi:hypothetical protein